MKFNTTLTLVLLLGSSIALNAMENNIQTPSALIDFTTLINEMCMIIPENANRKGSATQEEFSTMLNSALVDETYAFLNAAYQSDAIRPLIECVHDDLQKKVDFNAQTMSKEWTDFFFDSIIRQTVGYLALEHEFATHENVIVRFTASWCPPCQFFQPVLERTATVYASKVRIINVDITQHKILGMPVENIPLLVFFKNGKEVFRQTGLNIEGVTKKYADVNSPECKRAVLASLEEDLNKSIQDYLLS